MRAPAVCRVRDDRIRLDQAPPADVLSWIRDQAAVARVAVDARSGAIEVVVPEPRSLARLARSLEDRLFAALRRASPPPVLDVRVVHELPERARLAVSGVAETEIGRLGEWLRHRPGVSRARPSPASSSIVVWFDPGSTSAEALARDARASDPRTWPRSSAPEPAWRPVIANTGVLAASVALDGVLPAPLLGAAIAYTAIPSVQRTRATLRERRIGVDALDVAAIAVAIGTGRLATAAFITWLLGLGDLVLARTQARARRAISERLDLETAEAYRVSPDGIQRVEAQALRPGDLIVVDAGARVAADGVVEDGTALIDEKALTGESMPRTRQRGDRVLSASIVVEGQVIVRVERVGAQTTARRIAEVLAAAGAKPMSLQRTVERLADRVVLPTFALGGGAALVASELDRMTSVLITDFGTGLRIAVPTAALAAMITASRQGILIKGGQFLECLAEVDAIVFDKTGTLTTGEPRVVRVDTVGRETVMTCLGLAASAEARRHHPIARALRRAAERSGVAIVMPEVGSEVISVGRGVAAVVRGRHVVVGGKHAMRDHRVRWSDARGIVERHRAIGASSVFIAIDGRLAAVAAVADEPRAESAHVIDALRAGGRRRVIMLSGDATAVARAVGEELGLDRAEGELLPEDKVRIVRELQSEGRRVAMVGDGINDAPALAVADVGVSLNGSTDVALEAADVVLLDGGLARLPEVFRIADEQMRTVRRTAALVIAPNAIAIGLGALGLLQPSFAALLNNGSTVAAALAAVAPLLRPPRPEAPSARRPP